MGDEPKADEWARLLRRNWEELARSKYRDFFVASHRGWDDPATWRAQAEFDSAIVLHEIPPARWQELEVLEVGCGVGRLAQVIAPRARSYTGFDVAPSMVEEARARCRGLSNTRFFPSDGVGVPEPARDRRYDLALALAVFVHCPRGVISALIGAVTAVLAPRGEFRFQLRADEADLTGIAPSESAPIDAPRPVLRTGALDDEEHAALRQIQSSLDRRYFMGDAFRYDEVEPFVRAAAAHCTARLFRFDPQHIYVDLAGRPAGAG